MKEQITEMINTLQRFRKETYGTPNSEELYTLFGRGMANLIRVREYLEKQ